ncbi:MAG: tyrosine-type recombinase/integrase [Robiginitomaculum sp.]
MTAQKVGLVKCSAHGLRKAAERRLANQEARHQIMSILGHKSLAEAEKYTRAANQKIMAGKAIDLLSTNKIG